MPRIELSGRPIVITGASSGIGAATALACAQAGMPVAVGARRADKLDELVSRIRSIGGKAISRITDVTSPAQCHELVQACQQEFGTVYAVYANAGYGEECPLDLMSDAQVRAMFETNFFGSLNVIRPALEIMKTNEGPHRGHVLWCSSCLGKLSVPYYSIYCATKAAQVHVSRSMNLELREQGIYSTSVHPIGTRTEFFDQVRDRTKGKKIIHYTPESSMQTPEFVARCTLSAMRSPRPEVWTGFRGWAVRIGMSLATMVPVTTDRVMRRMVKAGMSEKA
jgi:NADP-dependent 3-hydroxy acid dehydrogenase YdfG